jgi:hypothetical protein
MKSPLEKARAAFADQTLPFPPIPEGLGAQIRAFGTYTFGTRPPQRPLYDIETFVADAVSGEIDDSVMFGIDGHGMNSWAAHYYLVFKHLALFLQFPWGGAYVDTESARADITSAFATVAAMLSREQQAPVGLMSGRRLVVVQSSFTMARWVWADKTSANTIDWQYDRFNALAAARASLGSA